MSGFNDEAKTEVEIMWTNQHGTGKKADHFVESQVILQYMCQEFPDGEAPLANINTQFEYHTIRNGGTSSTQTFRANQRESSDVKLTLGLHEPYNYYQSYLRRERNKGRTFYIRLEGTQQSLIKPYKVNYDLLSRSTDMLCFSYTRSASGYTNAVFQSIFPTFLCGLRRICL